MRAARLYHPGDLRVETVDRPVPGPGEALVRVHSTGVCGSDLPRIMVTGTYHFPCIPGHEFAGQVVECGSRVRDFRPGDRVAAAPLMPCGHCEMCRRGFFGQCENYEFLGSRNDGAFAEYVAVPEQNLLHLPPEVSEREAAVIEPAAVTLHGLYKLVLTGREIVAVFGCGTIGLLAVSMLKLLGAATVVAIDIDREKLTAARQLGADVVLDSLEQDPVAWMDQHLGGVHRAVETAGSPVTQEQCIRAVRSQGQVLFLGTAHRDVVLPPSTFERIVRREIRLVGSWNSYSAPFPGREWHDILRFLQEKKLSFEPLITHTISLEQLPQTVQDMAARTFSYIKVLVKIGAD